MMALAVLELVLQRLLEALVLQPRQRPPQAAAARLVRLATAVPAEQAARPVRTAAAVVVTGSVRLAGLPRCKSAVPAAIITRQPAAVRAVRLGRMAVQAQTAAAAVARALPLLPFFRPAALAATGLMVLEVSAAAAVVARVAATWQLIRRQLAALVATAVCMVVVALAGRLAQTSLRSAARAAKGLSSSPIKTEA
jgi:hypothetical protein